MNKLMEYEVDMTIEEPITAADLAKGMGKLRTKNLAFFEKQYPQIYHVFKDYKLEKHRINIDETKLTVDLIDDTNTPLYGGDALKYAQNEVTLFSNEFFGDTRRLVTIAPIYFEDYNAPRFFHRYMRSMLAKSPNKDLRAFDGYRIPKQTLPLVVFMGSGLGQQIELMVQERDILNMMIFEPNPDCFGASLYTTDWEAIITSNNRLNSADHSFHIIVGNIADFQNRFASIWNNLIHFCPFFPISTFFFNHQGKKEYLDLITHVNKETTKFINVFGYYDDEANQMNSTLHSVHRQVPLVGKTDLNIEKPVLIIGSGPSLEAVLEKLPEFRDKITLVSCGTSLSALRTKDIKPDIHVELESDLLTYETFKYKAEPEWVEDIIFIGPIHLSPLCFGYFKKNYAFIKAETAICGLLGIPVEKAIPMSAPSCTNAAVAFIAQMGFKNIALAGCDYGYKSVDEHHSESVSIYSSDSEYAETMKKNIERSDYEIPAVDGGKVVTTSFYYACWSSLDALTRSFGSKLKIKNLSKGASIANTVELNLSDYLDELKLHDNETRVDRIHRLETSLKKSIVKPLYSKSNLQDKANIFKRHLELTKNIFSKHEINSYDDIAKVISEFIIAVEFTQSESWRTIYFTLRGSLWHILYATYSHSMSLDEPEAVKFFREFIESYKVFSNDWGKHIEDVLVKDRSKFDPMIFRSVSEDEELQVPSAFDKKYDTDKLFKNALYDKNRDKTFQISDFEL